MLRVGLTGGLGSGKSFVAATLREFGCHVIHADLLGHEVIAPGGEAYADVVEAFGTGILDGSAIDRRKLAALVFPDPQALEKLNHLVHPHVFRREKELLDAFFLDHPDGVGVVEAAILLETGAYRNYDRIILAVCTFEQQIERAMKRDGMTREQVLERLGRQWPLDEKRKYADYVIDTSGSKAETAVQVEQVVAELKALAVQGRGAQGEV